MKKSTISVLSIVLLCTVLWLTGCNSYSSSYQAVGFVHSSRSDAASMSFFAFKGTMVFKLRCKQDAEKVLTYSATLESGNMTVYYAYDESKIELFSIDSGDDINASQPLPQQGTVYIIVETDEKCENGALRFSIE